MSTKEASVLEELDDALKASPKAKKASGNGHEKPVTRDLRKQGRKKNGAVKKGPNAPVGTKAKSPFALRTMRVDKDGKYGLDVKLDFDHFGKLIETVKEEVERGQGNGLHELVIVVR